MDRLKKEQTKRDVIKGGLRTRDVGVLCSERVPVNDKCVMVGTTGIAALKAEYGDDFTNFEIIQDVGYSSESSTHLSGDDTVNDHFNVRIYKYSKDNQPTPLNLREEFEAAGVRNFHSLGSSLESSSSAAVSLDDSGLGTGETMATGDSSELLGQFRVDDDYEQEDLDYLETVLDECVDFGANVVSEPEELHFNISGIESDDPSDNFHNRSSFTTSAQVFYKMISVDSDNGETESSPTNENNNISSMTITENCATDEITINNNNTIIDTNLEENNNNNNNMKCATSDSDVETFKHVQHPIAADNRGRVHKRPHRLYCSTPVRNLDDKYFGSHRHQGLKRKRDYDQADSNRMSNRVRSWLKRCSDFSSPPQRKSLLQTSSDVRQSVLTEDVSSCDASCECTSSSADEGNVYSSTSSFFDDDVFRQKTRIDSCSAEGSVETVVHALIDSEFNLLLPPPPSSTVSYGSDSKNCSTISCLSRKAKNQMKASSEGDVRKRRSLKELSNLNSRRVLNRRDHSKTTTCAGPRLCSSLPNVLRHSSDSSTDENCIPSTLLSHSDTKTTLYANRSSSSDVGRRRRRRSRKKSSSSNRSSTNALYSGGDRSRLRSRTYTSSTSRCGSRGRHMSQRSEAFCVEVFSDDEACPLKVEIPPEEDNVAFEDLRRASSVLLSPVESDIVLTHLEEQSTVSDQVWDGYQEMPYLSEGYSEATVDEDAVRKLTEFGDDYGSAIGNPIRLPDPADSNNNKTDSAQPHKKSPKIIPVNQRLQNINDDSDSDSEDLHYVIEAARKALHFAKATLKRRQTGDPLSSADYAELLATCGTHLNCLQSVCEHIEIDGKGHNFSSCDLTQLNYLIEEWQELQRSVEMYEKLEDPARQKYLKAQENIDALFNKMSQLSSSSYLDISSWEDVEKNMTRLQMVLTSLQEAKEQLLAVNLQAHRFTTEYGDDDSYKDCSLKNDITELYRQWEDTYEQNGLQLTELGMLKSDWETYDAKFRNLRHKVKEAEFTSGDDCDNICLMSTDNDSASLMKEFEELRHVAGSLEKHLKGGDAWKKIDEDMKDLRLKVYRNDAPPQIAASPSVNHRCPSTIVEEDADDHFEDAIQQLCDDSDHSDVSTPQKKDGPAAVTTPKRSRGRFWRIVRVAVPVQFALVLLYCLACYLEPTCCNMLNNFNFSFTPQLRYLGGRPPV